MLARTDASRFNGESVVLYGRDRISRWAALQLLVQVGFGSMLLKRCSLISTDHKGGWP